MIKNTQNAFLAGIIALAITGCSGTEDEKPVLPPETSAEEVDRLAHELAERTMRPFEYEVETAQSVEPSRSFMVDWKFEGESLEDVVGGASFVVSGRVVSQRSVVTITPVWDSEKGRYLTREETGRRDIKFELPETISTIEIDQVLASSDASVTRGGTVEIRELGGYFSDGTVGVVADKPLLVVGQKAIFAVNGAQTKGAYHEIGGIQGRFMIEDGVVRPLYEGFRPAYDGRPVTELVSEITRLRADR
jgi:hypothetical protein